MIKMIAVDSPLSFDEKLRVAESTGNRLDMVLINGKTLGEKNLIPKTPEDDPSDVKRLARLFEHLSWLDTCRYRLPRRQRTAMQLLFPVCIARVGMNTPLSYQRDNQLSKLMTWKPGDPLGPRAGRTSTDPLLTRIPPQDVLKRGGNNKRERKTRCCTECRKARGLEIPVKGHLCPLK